MILLMLLGDIVRTATLLCDKSDMVLIIEFDTLIILLCCGLGERGAGLETHNFHVSRGTSTPLN